MDGTKFHSSHILTSLAIETRSQYSFERTRTEVTAGRMIKSSPWVVNGKRAHESYPDPSRAAVPEKQKAE
jgi:hypothetical protein